MLIWTRYYGIIHPTYPILPTTRAKMLSRLVGCPATLREAFYEALHAAVRSYPSSNVHNTDPPSPRKASQLVALSELEPVPTQSYSAKIIYLQTMLLLAAEAETHPPSAAGQEGRSRSVWLGGAVGVSYSMKLHLHKPFDKLTENDPDTDEKLGRRLWWSLVIMDRWHASSTASPSLIPDSSVVVYPEDQALLGDDLYQLARKFILCSNRKSADILTVQAYQSSWDIPLMLRLLQLISQRSASLETQSTARFSEERSRDFGSHFLRQYYSLRTRPFYTCAIGICEYWRGLLSSPWSHSTSRNAR